VGINIKILQYKLQKNVLKKCETTVTKTRRTTPTTNSFKRWYKNFICFMREILKLKSCLDKFVSCILLKKEKTLLRFSISYLFPIIVCRLRELHTLKGHVESVVRLKGLDIDTIQQAYTVWICLLYICIVIL